MKITVKRKRFSDISTIGELEIDGEFVCFTLEDRDRRLEEGYEKVPGSTAIPRGKYKVTIDQSVRFKKRMPHILNVPGFEGVRIHSGNTAADTSGCILLGAVVTDNDAIGNSRVAYNDFFAQFEDAIEEGREVTIEVN